MRSNTYYHNLERAPDKQNPEREKLEAQIKEYLSKGGQITKIPRGVHAQNAMPLSTVQRNIEKQKAFGDET
jgi:hypothetical protein